ncbi:WG repeat-containing protein [Mesonia mobilis]|uniref:WG containing repeat-containing protein n=1 Tax=Mesonia mobilis TaxID=369791 RepID=A0ABQ3BH29_9FLAO|nr:WG repeat-containing protein [Mesonia mobilis]MBQ0739042.1 WG repeat-containing protein [Aquimarina celericrescens]GGZ44453.1 hypothetical protein GCM10008088_01820 [Mesonia mobilis]
MKIKLLITISFLLLIFSVRAQHQQKYDFIDSFTEGFAPIKQNEKWGFISQSEKLIVKPTYDYVFPFSEGMAVVVENGKWGYVNTKGKVVITPQYRFASHFSNGLARVFKDGKYGFIDKKNETKISFEYEDAEDFKNGLAVVAQDKEKEYGVEREYSLINENQNELTKKNYSWISNTFNNVYKSMDWDDTLVFFKIKDKMIENISSTEFDDLRRNFLSHKDAAARKILKANNIEFDGIWSFSENMVVFNLNNLYGFFNENNKKLVKPQYARVGEKFKDGLLAVKLNNSYFFVDKIGNPVSINLINPVEKAEEYEASYGIDTYSLVTARDYFNKVVAPAPPPPPAPEIIELVEDDVEIEEEVIASKDTYERVTVNPELGMDVPFTAVDQVPIMPGCEDAANQKKCTSIKINEFFEENYNKSLASNIGLSGIQRVYLRFKINTTGDVVYIQARAPHPKLEEEALRVARELPTMIAGEEKGKKVGVLYSLPIIFDVE